MGTWYWTWWGGRFSWSRYSGNAGEGRNLLTTIREPQLYATEGFMRMWVISSTVESNIINTCCCFFCFCKNAHTKVLCSNTSIWFYHALLDFHAFSNSNSRNEMLQDCRHLHAHKKILWHEMQCGDEGIIACVHGVIWLYFNVKTRSCCFSDGFPMILDNCILSLWFWVTLFFEVQVTHKIDLTELDTFLFAPTSSKVWDTLLSVRWLANPSRACSHVLQNSTEVIWIPHSSSKCRFSCALRGHIGPPITLTIESRIVGVFWACSPNSFNTRLFGIRA